MCHVEIQTRLKFTLLVKQLFHMNPSLETENALIIRIYYLQGGLLDEKRAVLMR
jgi:hypothetical protein